MSLLEKILGASSTIDHLNKAMEFTQGRNLSLAQFI